MVALSFLPPAILGVAFERPIERRLGGPLATAIGLLAGAAAMFVADRRPQLRDRGRATAPTGSRSGSPRRLRWPRASLGTEPP